MSAEHADRKEEDGAVPPDFVCPISQMVMEDPVMTEDGHTYERSCITEWLRPGRMHSPMTSLLLSSRHVLPNHSLRNAIEQWRRHDGVRQREALELKDIRFAVQLREEDLRQKDAKQSSEVVETPCIRVEDRSRLHSEWDRQTDRRTDRD